MWTFGFFTSYSTLESMVYKMLVSLLKNIPYHVPFSISDGIKNETLHFLHRIYVKLVSCYLEYRLVKLCKVMVKVSHSFQSFIATLCHRYVSHNVNLNTNVVGRFAMK